MTGADRRPAVLVLAGLDPSGGAGLSVDQAVLQGMGVHPLPVPTCLTVQSRLGFREAHPVADDTLRAMAAAAREHLAPQAVKVGLLAGPGQVETVAGALPEGVPCVVDPVLRPTLAPAETAGLAAALVATLLPRGVVLTPNGPELRALTGLEDPGVAAAALLDGGAGAVVLTGGHGRGPLRNLLLLPGGERHEYAVERVQGGEVHGTGCAFSAALAAALARGSALPAAVGEAGRVTAGLLRRAWSAGPGPGVLGFPVRD